jgi:glycosyltransferase involved in cell wall biosynthesis
MARHDGIEVFASVPDIRPYLAGSAIAVVPLRLGSGTRLKILEALAACRPVVSTRLGAEGLDLQPDHDLLLADTAPAFADAVVRLLERPEDARRLAVQGRETVRRNYSWDSIGATFQAMLRAVVD